MKAVAGDAGYDVTGITTKANLITAILAAQEVDTTDTLTEDDLALFTAAKIVAIGAGRGYDITETTKANIITAFTTTQAVDITGTLTETELGYFTVEKILAIAEDRGYTMTSTAETAKATVITEFLAAQEAAAVEEAASE